MKTKATTAMLNPYSFSSNYTFPTCSAQELSTVSDIKVLSPIELNKKHYLVCDGKIRAFKVLDIFITPFHRSHYVVRLEVAGLGIGYVVCNFIRQELPFDIYESPRDFKDNKKYKPTYENFTHDTLKLYWRFDLRWCGGVYNLVRWVWDGFRAVARRLDIEVPTAIRATEHGYYLVGDDLLGKKIAGYISKEACEEDNDVEVCDFDDEPTEDKEEEEYIRLQVEIKKSDYEKLNGIVNIIEQP